jgi:TolA-binding protein
MDYIITRQHQTEERISDMEDKIKELLHANNNKENKMTTHEFNIQELWDMIKRPNLRIHRMRGAEIQTKGIGNLFNEIITENSPNLCSNVDIHVQEAF